ncbi:MAG: DUF7714 family protein [Acidimicrobiales bacterium]
MTNLWASQYRQVAVATVDFPLEAPRLREYLLGREVYRRTQYVVFRRGAETAVVEVVKAPSEQVMTVVAGVSVLALPPDCAFVEVAGVDTGIPSALAEAAATHAPGARMAVVEGRYHHINFILDPAPLSVRVVDLVPPGPPKLVDQAARILGVAEELPPIRLVPDVVDLADVARMHPSTTYLLPCRGSGFALPAGIESTARLPAATGGGLLAATGGAAPAPAPAVAAAQTTAMATPDVAFLDERPPRRDWTLLGCARSRELHRWFYGDLPACVDICPRRLAARSGRPAARSPDPTAPAPATSAVSLTKCCLLEDRIEHDGTTVVVPWGASLDQVRQGLQTAVDLALVQGPERTSEPAWSPA